MTDSGSQPSDDRVRWARLTEKQRDCLDLLLERQTSKQIARHLDISKQAVDLRLTTARGILGTANRDETAIAYARLRQTYDRIPCDPVILPPPAPLVPSDFADGAPDKRLALDDIATLSGRSPDFGTPFKDYWRHDHPKRRRGWMMAAMFAVAIFLIFVGVNIGETLTRLFSS